MSPRQRSLMLAGAVWFLLFPAGQGLAQEARGRDIDFRGPVAAVSRDSKDDIVLLTVRVNQSQIDVAVTGWTQVIVGRGFPADRNRLRLGDFLQVSGFFNSQGRIVARRIHIENRNALELAGTLEQVSGNLLRISGLDFLIYEDSVIRPSGGGPGKAAELVPGTPVRLRADEDGGLWRIRELECGERTVESEPLRFEGVVQKREGELLYVDVGLRLPQVVPAVVFVDRETRIQGYLRNGALIEIEGRFLPGQSLVRADRIAVDGNGNQNIHDDIATPGSTLKIELEGIVRSSPQAETGGFRFLVGETVIHVGAGTQFLWSDGSIASIQDIGVGSWAHVAGTRLEDRSIQAVRVELRKKASDDESGNGDGSGDPDPGGGDDGGGEQDGGAGDDGAGGDTVATLVGVIGSVLRRPDDTVIQFVLGETTVQLDSNTVVVRDNETVSSALLSEGQEVRVWGSPRPNGSLLAERIEIKR